MILTGPEIERVMAQTRMGIGPERIVIEPPPPKVGPNSADVRLAPVLKVYALYDSPYAPLFRPEQLCSHLSTRRPTDTADILIPPNGFVLLPNVLYLGSTFEHIECDALVPWIDGRSSTGRLSVAIHKTAGRGDDGWKGNLTLEISVTHPCEVFAGDVIGQLTFFTIRGARRKYTGRYQNSTGSVPSRMHEELP